MKCSCGLDCVSFKEAWLCPKCDVSEIMKLAKAAMTMQLNRLEVLRNDQMR